MVFSTLAGIASKALPFLSRSVPFLGRAASGLLKGARGLGGLFGKALGSIGNIFKGGRAASALSRGASIAGKIGKGIGTGIDIADKALTAAELAKEAGLLPKDKTDAVTGAISTGIGRAKAGRESVFDFQRGLSSASNVFA